MLISKRSAFDFTIICIFAISIAGIFGSLMVNMDNGNQGYFVYCSAICIALNGAVYIDRIADKKKIMYVS